MTGGEVVILGNIGDNFGAGMTGGSAFIYSDQKNLTEMMNKETIQAYQILEENWKKYLYKLLTSFSKETKSKRASYIIENFEQEISKFIHVVPNEVVDKLNYPVIEQHKIA
jgi:glutamate synthase (NADPH/NADH) large chain